MNKIDILFVNNSNINKYYSCIICYEENYIVLYGCQNLICRNAN